LHLKRRLLLCRYVNGDTQELTDVAYAISQTTAADDEPPRFVVWAYQAMLYLKGVLIIERPLDGSFHEENIGWMNERQ
jgi:hypothetical protein